MTAFVSDLVEYYAPSPWPTAGRPQVPGLQYASIAGRHRLQERHRGAAEKAQILAGYEAKVREIQDAYMYGNLSDTERRERVTDLWTEATEEVGIAMEKNFRRLNPVFMMANSGARGSFKQIRQLAGMRVLWLRRRAISSRTRSRPTSWKAWGARVLHLHTRRP